MRIAIIGAMEEEVVLLRDKIENQTVDVIAGCEYTSGQMNGAEVVLLRSGIGKVNAAMSTTILLDKFKPDYVINTGSAGGSDENLNVGDIVISTEVRHHDVDVTAFDYEYGQVPKLPPAFLADEELIKVAWEGAKELEGVHIVQGLIASGDTFVNELAVINHIRGKFNAVKAVEMEAAAIAQVCHQFGVPFVIIRSLSDIAGKESNISFEQYLKTAALHSAKLVMKMAELLKVR